MENNMEHTILDQLRNFAALNNEGSSIANEILVLRERYEIAELSKDEYHDLMLTLGETMEIEDETLKKSLQTATHILAIMPLS
jgi:hypothetical protein